MESAGRMVADTTVAAAEGVRGAPDFWRNAIVDPTAPGAGVVAGVEGALMGGAAFIDGGVNLIPGFEFKPFERAGIYDSSKDGLGWSQVIGSGTRDASLLLLGGAAWQAGKATIAEASGLSFLGVTPWGMAATSATGHAVGVASNLGAVSAVWYLRIDTGRKVVDQASR